MNTIKSIDIGDPQDQNNEECDTEEEDMRTVLV